LKKLEGIEGAPMSWGQTRDELCFRERGFAYRLPESAGQKTGFYFDLRDLRGRVEHWAKGARVLDCYSYLGSFALAAARGGAASVESCESNAAIVELAKTIASANGFAQIRQHVADTRDFLSSAEAHSCDLIILDPPKLAHSAAQRDKAQRIFQALLTTAFAKVCSGGMVVVCSCSHALGLPELERAAALAARETGACVSIVERAFQAADHRTLVTFPEGLYLSALVLHVEH
jgi:23S rRNA (cytosine1962-C5)-methyltransferase